MGLNSDETYRASLNAQWMPYTIKQLQACFVQDLLHSSQGLLDDSSNVHHSQSVTDNATDARKSSQALQRMLNTA